MIRRRISCDTKSKWFPIYDTYLRCLFTMPTHYAYLRCLLRYPFTMPIYVAYLRCHFTILIQGACLRFIFTISIYDAYLPCLFKVLVYDSYLRWQITMIECHQTINTRPPLRNRLKLRSNAPAERTIFALL